MPYPTLDSLPDWVKDMPKHAQEIYQAAWNSAYEQYKDEGKAAATAITAVKTKYEKNAKGDWVAKETITEGGGGSGNFGHEGRPGEVGGSGGGGGGRDKFVSEKISASPHQKGEFAKGTFSNSAVMERTQTVIKEAKIPDRHLEHISKITVDADKIAARGQMVDATFDSSNNEITLGRFGNEAVIHEIGHGVMQGEIFGAKRGGEVMTVFAASSKTGKGFVSSYAKTDVREFFAESYDAYAKNPAGFSKLNPPMAKILKSIW